MPTARQSLVPGGHLEDAQLPLTYISQTPPAIHPGSYILAVVSTPVSDLPSDDWFLSDFYAFNYLFNGLGSEQKWLTVADPRAVLKKIGRRYEESYGEMLLHGNPYQDRRVVLSEDLLNNKQLTPPTIVKKGTLTDRFLEEAKASSEAARKKDVPLVILAFCHGIPNQLLMLDNKHGLSATILKGYLEPGTQVTFITTACYSGGWVVNPDFRDTVIAAAAEKRVSIAWTQSDSLGRTCGSIFVSSLIDTLTSTTTPLIEQTKESGSGEAGATQRKQISSELQPDSPNDLQTSTYNTFCHTIWDSCKSLTRLHPHHSFSFSAKYDQWDHSWSGLTGIPVGYYKERWEKLAIVKYRGSEERKSNMDQDPNNPGFLLTTPNAPTGGAEFTGEITGDLIENMRNDDIRQTARIFLEHACPTDWQKGRGVGLASLLRSCAEGKRPNVIPNPDPYSFWERVEVMAAIQYRWNLSLFCDNIVKTHGLPVPSGKDCLFWNDWAWEDDIGKRMPEWETRQGKIEHELIDRGFLLTPSDEQGPEMLRSVNYVAAAILEADLPEDKTIIVIDQVLHCMRQFQDFEQQRTIPSIIKDPRVWEKGRDWLRSIGRRIGPRGSG